MEPFDIENAIVSTFEDITAQLEHLAEHIQFDLACLPLWVDNGLGELMPERDRAIDALKHFKMSEGLNAQETSACIGVIGCKEETLSLIDSINKTKDKLKSIVELYLEHYQAERSRDTAIIRHLLAAHGHPQLKLKQVYRHIRYIKYHPRRISFSQASHRSYKTINRKKAEEMLQAVGQGENIDAQLVKLQGLDSKEKLVICHDINKCWIANISTFKNQYGHTETEQYRTSIPLFYIHNPSLSMPKVVFSKKYTKHKAEARNDKQLEDKPFLASISAYRYIK